jgi:L-ascorbate metabolism protein UlaG (beta-lactamase superfamily)
MVPDGRMALTFVGQATFLITTPHATILTDPIFSDRASPLSFAGPKRAKPPGLALDVLPPIDVILLSHNHYDHMDLASLRRLRGGGAKPVPIVTGLGNGRYLARKGVPGAAELDWWERISLRPGVTITFVPAQHWSSRTLRDRRTTLWGGFVIETGGTRLYFAGDSAYCPWFKAIGERLGPPDVALLPIGAYEPRWFMQGQHMNPAEAVQAHLDLGARQSFGMHFGTFQLTDEAIDEPLHALDRARQAAGIGDAFATLDIGETRIVETG